MTRVWCLQAEGDYARIRVSLCLLCSENRNGRRCFALVRVCICVYVGGGNIIVPSHLHSLVYML